MTTWDKYEIDINLDQKIKVFDRNQEAHVEQIAEDFVERIFCCGRTDYFQATVGFEVEQTDTG